MPMILAMNGADFGFANFGAASSAIADLQAALVSLGKGIGDNTLSKIVVDGLMGPKTAAATNRALTVHLGTGQAPANLRTGNLSQTTIKSQAAQITQLIDAEVRRRGFSVLATKIAKPKAKAVVKPVVTSTSVAPPAVSAGVQTSTYVPPAAAAAVSPVYRVPAGAAGGGMDMSAIIKWSAIGVGAVAVLGIGYYLATRRSPAMAGFSMGEAHPFDLCVAKELGRGRSYEKAIEICARQLRKRSKTRELPAGYYRSIVDVEQ